MKDVNGGHGYENRSTDRNEFLSGNNMPMVERLTQPVNKKPIQGSIETKQKGVRSDNQSKTGTGGKLHTYLVTRTSKLIELDSFRRRGFR